MATVVNIFAADSEEPAAQVKAEMLYEFVSYTKWPEQAFSAEDSPYRVWVLSAEELANTLQNMAAERRPNGRPIEVFKASSPEQISEPHVVFIGRGAEHSPQVEELMKTRSALVITENSNGLKSGSIINLQPADGRVYFEISVENAQKSNLEISSRLLSIASSVEQ